ncbi:MAG: starch synthase [Myxococcota bacterium]|jgi:starch synthase
MGTPSKPRLSQPLPPNPGKPITVVHVVSEVTPFAESGGLGLVAGSLPPALKALGVNVIVVAPRYRSINKELWTRTDTRFDVQIGRRKSAVTLCEGELSTSDGQVPVYLLDCPPAFDRKGIYGHRSARDYADNSWRFALLCQGALQACDALGLNVDVFHGHDWPTGLLPLMIDQRRNRASATVHTIHNLGYHGQFTRDTIAELGLDWSCWHPDGAEFWGQLNFLKAGLNYADKITTVSPTYAEEIRSEEMGHGLDGVLRSRGDDLVGILNGVDYGSVAPKRDDRQALIKAFELDAKPDTMILGMVSRLVSQKGIDLIAPATRSLLEAGRVRLALLGTGEEALETELRELAHAFPGLVGTKIQYNNELARLVTSGSDALLMPSRYEPCGLSQMFALRYGTLPVVRATGGLADTVRDGQTGFAFTKPTAEALEVALWRTLDAFGEKKRWDAMKKAAKAEDFSWDASAQKYVELYEEIVRG